MNWLKHFKQESSIPQFVHNHCKVLYWTSGFFSVSITDTSLKISIIHHVVGGGSFDVPRIRWGFTVVLWNINIPRFTVVTRHSVRPLVRPSRCWRLRWSRGACVCCCEMYMRILLLYFARFAETYVQFNKYLIFDVVCCIQYYYVT